MRPGRVPSVTEGTGEDGSIGGVADEAKRRAKRRRSRSESATGPVRPADRSGPAGARRRTVARRRRRGRTRPSGSPTGTTAGRLLQRGETPSLPHSRPTFFSIDPGCRGPRVNDRDETRRVVYRLDADAMHVLDVFAKTRATPDEITNA